MAIPRRRRATRPTTTGFHSVGSAKWQGVAARVVRATTLDRVVVASRNGRPPEVVAANQVLIGGPERSVATLCQAWDPGSLLALLRIGFFVAPVVFVETPLFGTQGHGIASRSVWASALEGLEHAGLNWATIEGSHFKPTGHLLTNCVVVVVVEKQRL